MLGKAEVLDGIGGTLKKLISLGNVEGLDVVGDLLEDTEGVNIVEDLFGTEVVGVLLRRGESFETEGLLIDVVSWSVATKQSRLRWWRTLRR